MSNYEQDNDYDEDEEEQEDEETKRGPESRKEQLVFLVDTQPDMFQEIEGPGGRQTLYDVAKDIAYEFLKGKVIQNPDDQVGVILYNTREKRNESHQFDAVYVLLPLEGPSAEAIKAVRDLSVEAFRAQVGSAAAPAADTLHNALWVAQHLLAASKTETTKRLVVLTCDPQPYGAGPRAADMRRALLTRLETLASLGASARLLPLGALTGPFDYGPFWREALALVAGEEEEGGPAEDEQFFAEMAAAPDQRRDPAAALASLFYTLRRRLARKRTLLRTAWRIGPELRIAVKGYVLVGSESERAANMRAVSVNAVTNEVLRVVTTLVAEDTAELVERSAVRQRCYEFKAGSKPDAPHVIPPVVFELDELSRLRRLAEPGLVLLGFKPRDCLKDYHQLRSSTFLRPDEARAEGSTRAFIAIWREMLALDKVALCRYTRGGSNPTHHLVALLPQAEVLDPGSGAQLEPPGLHMLYLPYADDIRQPEKIPDQPPQRPTAEQLDAAAALIDALQLEPAGPDGEPAERFDPGEICNPALQRHYRVLEAVALHEPIPEWVPEVDDQTLPRPERFETAEAAAAIEAFREAFPQDLSDRGTKRRAEGEGTAAAARKQKAAEVEDEYNAFNWEHLARSGGLEKLKIDQLKLYLKRHELKLTGKKAELTHRIAEHMGLAA